jgi:hypothetical protein
MEILGQGLWLVPGPGTVMGARGTVRSTPRGFAFVPNSPRVLARLAAAGCHVPPERDRFAIKEDALAYAMAEARLVEAVP